MEKHRDVHTVPFTTLEVLYVYRDAIRVNIQLVSEKASTSTYIAMPSIARSS